MQGHHQDVYNSYEHGVKIVLYRDSSSFDGGFWVRPVVCIKVIVAKREFSFIRDFSFCNRGNRNVMVSIVILPYLSLRGYIKAPNIMSCNGKI